MDILNKPEIESVVKADESIMWWPIPIPFAKIEKKEMLYGIGVIKSSDRASRPKTICIKSVEPPDGEYQAILFDSLLKFNPYGIEMLSDSKWPYI